MRVYEYMAELGLLYLKEVELGFWSDFEDAYLNVLACQPEQLLVLEEATRLSRAGFL